MCGILASLSFQQAAPALPVESLRHRGPDGSGEWRSPDERCWLGHTRLAILDPSPAGAQPMVDPATGCAIAFNGEIYNHLQLRAELPPPATGWRGHSDTETILHAYRQWGDRAWPALRGMFALALHDPRDRTLRLVRDRLGIKPLHYRVRPNQILAASEIRPLQVPDDSLSPIGLADYLRWGHATGLHPLWTGILEVPPGTCLRFDPDERQHANGFWPPASFPRPAGDPVQVVREALEVSVREHLLSDVPVAVFLSGGLDSSLITALAARHASEPLRTFSVGFPQARYDETAAAAAVARHCGTRHQRLEISPEWACRLVPQAVDAMDSPSVDALNTYLISRAVTEHGLKVALSGLGGDELFGGYPSYRDAPRLARFSRLPRGLRRILGGARLADLPTGCNLAEAARWRRKFISETELAALGLPTATTWAYPSPPDLDPFSIVSWQELTGYLRGMLLRDSDQMSMAVSLELRVPFLDHRLVEWVLGLPDEAKRGRSPKHLLREACSGLLPDGLDRLPKRGFVLPMREWMLGPLREYVQEGLRLLPHSTPLAQPWIEDQDRQFCSEAHHWTRLWRLVVLGHHLARRGLRPSGPQPRPQGQP